MNALVDGKDVISMLGNLFDIVGCKINNDYDCDGIPNTQDNCPREYNPSQRDADRDGVGDVCDEDIDGDGVKNPLGIVDDLGHVVVRLWTGNGDQCIFMSGTNCLQNMLGLSVAVQRIQQQLPARVEFSALVKGIASALIWDFGDGNFGSGAKPVHFYQKPGVYVVQVRAKGQENDAFATTTVVIGNEEKEKYALQVLLDTKKVPGGEKNPVQLQMGASLVGIADQVVRKIGKNPGVVKPDTFVKLFSMPGEYIIQVKASMQGTLKAAAVFTVGVGS
jgi:hypothetical protein